MSTLASIRDRVGKRLKYAHFPYVQKALSDNQKSATDPLRILDVGCGPGNLSDFCRDSVQGEWYGLDLWEHELRQAADKNVYTALYRVNLVYGVPFQDQSFDVVVCSEVLMYLPNAGEVLAEFYRVLKPGGTLFVHNPISWVPELAARLKTLWRSVYREKGAVVLDRETSVTDGRRVCRVTYYSLTSLQREIEKAHFRIMDVVGFRLFRNRIRFMTRLEDFDWYHRLVRVIVGRYPTMATDILIVGTKQRPACPNA